MSSDEVFKASSGSLDQGEYIHFVHTSSGSLETKSLRYFQNVFNTSCKDNFKMCSRHLQDIFKMSLRRSQDVPLKINWS